MGVWVYVVAYLVAFVVIQLVVYRYLRGRNGDAGVALASGSNADRGAGRDPEASDRNDPLDRRSLADADATSDRRCPACGTANDPDGPYTFCRNCATRLPG